MGTGVISCWEFDPVALRAPQAVAEELDKKRKQSGGGYPASVCKRFKRVCEPWWESVYGSHRGPALEPPGAFTVNRSKPRSSLRARALALGRSSHPLASNVGCCVRVSSPLHPREGPDEQGQGQEYGVGPAYPAHCVGGGGCRPGPTQPTVSVEAGADQDTCGAHGSGCSASAK